MPVVPEDDYGAENFCFLVISYLPYCGSTTHQLHGYYSVEVREMITLPLVHKYSTYNSYIKYIMWDNDNTLLM